MHLHKSNLAFEFYKLHAKSFFYCTVLQFQKRVEKNNVTSTFLNTNYTWNCVNQFHKILRNSLYAFTDLNYEGEINLDSEIDREYPNQSRLTFSWKRVFLKNASQ